MAVDVNEVVDVVDVNDEAMANMEFDSAEVDRLRAESIQIVRDLILKGHRDLIPEMVHGATLAELMDSIEPARNAYQRIAELMRTTAPVVPAGGAGSGVAIEHLSADSLIKRGLARKWQ